MDASSPRIGSLLGDYRLDQLLRENSSTIVWLAEQASVRRPVVLLELKPEHLDRREPFLANIRAMAAVDHPRIASVYEAVSTPTNCHVTLERLPGTHLATRLLARETFPPLRLAQILRHVAEAHLALESRGTSVAPLQISDIYLDSQGLVRLVNPARAGTRSPEESPRDLATLGSQLPPFIAVGQPGTSRIQTLLAWMRLENIDRPLTWQEVLNFAEQIEQQLSEPLTSPVPTSQPSTSSHRSLTPILGIIVTVIAIATVLALSLRSKPAATTTLPSPIPIPAGTHPTAEGTDINLPAFEISAHEVTIGEYRNFLQAIDRLPQEQQRTFDHPEQPENKTSHLPDDWDAILKAIRTSTPWNGIILQDDSPIVNVDWWDAVAFCNWKAGCRLPTYQEWFAALRYKLPNPASLQPSGASPISSIAPGDHTPAGLLGMAGSVGEWILNPLPDPSNPLGRESYLIAGASYLQPAQGALARTWVEDRLRRRPDLGFRIVYHAP